ncbi:hypothetical protein EUGRSUZ_H03660 [Eucalyptus grandis]|uniref:Uncharacterized protein n=2 Tax=Eucalyptus grandis TaxID=71139 RepID=A0ACC3JUT2_EUCGR|nr:hypothetical protein EUGRSUZ_H03660 [Eucalyptus grandis]
MQDLAGCEKVRSLMALSHHDVTNATRSFQYRVLDMQLTMKRRCSSVTSLSTTTPPFWTGSSELEFHRKLQRAYQPSHHLGT